MIRPAIRRHRALRATSDRGSASLFVLVVLSGIIVIIGLVVDGSRASAAVAKADSYAQEAARAAAAEITYASALRGGTPELDPAAARQAAQQYLAAAGVSGEISIDSPTQVTVIVTLSAPTAFLSIVGIDTFTVHGEGTATVTAVT